ncbi:vacuolar fusion protein MON1 homolog A-like isoform X2 [Xenia sp. Carnegie-2017]|uniref:vacuolar fusion protein MON1 homolog A-like isoform X2 n=1 Tax=Xenia sp. Carnegie-2017 TaxID=2897299 RepID=UPI001F03BD2F|nr:vacuolar fusion protein MON1 homolog A-like isoform X2 [Xenia sp. Carnegie-2017]
MAESTQTCQQDNVKNYLEINGRLPVDCEEGQEPGACGGKAAPLFEAENEDEFDHVYEEKNGIQKSTSCGRLAHLCNSEEEYILIDENTNGINTSESSNNEENETGEEDVEVLVGEMTLADENDKEGKATAVIENGRNTRKYFEEDVNHPDWIKHKKHIFVLSSAGKPIYSRYGNEEKLSTLTGVMQALVSFVEDDKNQLRSIVAGDHKFVFLVKGHLILVAISYAKESSAQMAVQLTHVYHQILSVLTHKQLERIMNQRGNYDLRRLLGGTEKFIDSLLDLMDHEPSVLLGAVRCLPLKSSIREMIGQSFVQAKVKELVFAVLIANNQLITLVRPKMYSLHPGDLHLILNLVNGSTSFQTAESWTPICLPRFDNSGYLYAHVSYLSEECPACLLLLSTVSDAFFILSECRLKVIEKLHKYKCFQAINEAMGKESYRIGDIGILIYCILYISLEVHHNTLHLS